MPQPTPLIPVDPEERKKKGMPWGAATTAALIAGHDLIEIPLIKRWFSARSGIRSSRLTYLNLGLFIAPNQRPAGIQSFRDLTGRSEALVKDVIYEGIRRLEETPTRIFRTFELSSLFSTIVFRDTSGAVARFSGEEALKLRKYVTRLAGRDIGVEEIAGGMRVIKGSLYGVNVNGEIGKEPLVKFVTFMQRKWTPYHEKIKGARQERLSHYSKLAKEYEAMIAGEDFGRIAAHRGESDFLLLVGGRNRSESSMRTINAFLRVQSKKFFHLLDDPFEALQEITGVVSKRLGRGSRLWEKIGIRGKLGLAGDYSGSLAEMWARWLLPGKGKMGWRLGAIGSFVALPFIYKIAEAHLKVPNTILEEGPTAALATLYAKGDILRGQVSEALGIQSFIEKQEELAPGSTKGIMSYLAFPASFAMTGAVASGALTMTHRLSKGMLGAREEAQALRRLSGPLGKLIKKSLPRAHRWAYYGAAIGAIAAAPFALGAALATVFGRKPVQQRKEEYAGIREIPIRKGRWWEAGRTPYEGGRILTYAPHFVVRARTHAKEKALYGEYWDKPITRLFKSIVDPYWLERMHNEDRPYPIWGPSDPGLGFLGTIWQHTLGALFKPPVYVNQDKYITESGEYIDRDTNLKYEPSYRLGGELPDMPEPKTGWKYALSEIKRRLADTFGLTGFALESVEEKMTGSTDLFEDKRFLASSAELDSTAADFWGLHLGGGLTTTEALRRIYFKERPNIEVVNPAENNMPSWLPGDDYMVNFHTGNPYTKIPMGEYVLPGPAYEELHPELKGVPYEDYPLIHKLNILKNVAVYSKEFTEYAKTAKRIIAEGKEDQAYIEQLNSILEQAAQMKKLEVQEIPDDNIISSYWSLLNESAANPTEYLTPIAPIHKFVHTMGPIDTYRDTQILSSEVTLWNKPYEHFIKPAIRHLFGVAYDDYVPKEVRERQNLSDYFEALKYIKYKNLLNIAKERGLPSYLYERRVKSNLFGISSASREDDLYYALPRIDKKFFEFFINAEGEEREEISNLVSPMIARAYNIFWAKHDGKSSYIPAFTASDVEEYLEDKPIPGPNWIGWDSDVDLEDIKLKLLERNFEDFTEYDIWGDQIRASKRKPYLERALDEFNVKRSKAEVKKQIEQMLYGNGLENVEVLVDDYTGENVIFFEGKDSQEKYLRSQMRDMGFFS